MVERRAIALFHPREPGGKAMRKRLGEYGLDCTMIGRPGADGYRWYVDLHHASKYREERVLHIPEETAAAMHDALGTDAFVRMAIAVLGR